MRRVSGEGCYKDASCAISATTQERSQCSGELNEMRNGISR